MIHLFLYNSLSGLFLTLFKRKRCGEHALVSCSLHLLCLDLACEFVVQSYHCHCQSHADDARLPLEHGSKSTIFNLDLHEVFSHEQ
jgi:hypothetical protein